MTRRLPAPPRRPRCVAGISRLLIAPSLLALLSLTWELAAQDPLSGTNTGVAEPVPAAEEEWSERRREAEKRRQSSEQQRDQLLARNPETTPPQWLAEKIELLQYLELICAQRESLAEQRRELDQRAANERQQLELLRDVGPEESPPYSFLLLDQLRDQRAGEISRRNGVRSEIEATKQLVASLQENHQEAERKRRRIQEEVGAAAGAGDGAGEDHRLELARLYSEVLETALGYRNAELENARRELAIAELRVTYLDEKIALVAERATFSQADLDALLAELDREEEEIRRQIDRARKDLQRAEQQWLAARHQAESQPENQAAAEKVQALETERETTHTILSLQNERLADVLLCRHVWNRRFRMANQAIAVAEYREWANEAEGFAQRLQQSVNRANLRVREEMRTLATLEERLLLVERDNPEQAAWIQSQIDTLQKEINAFGIGLVRIDRVQRLLGQFQDELQAEIGTEQSVWGERIAAGLQTCWNYELTSIDDRPITVKKIITGVILLLFGYGFSRYLSRLIGRRLLPRIGLDSGVTNALQTIAFYAFLVIFSLFSLQLISIPLTVFAFLGGAVAIGVGFGSQNILNNFISGLILLAERPIRVGDLIEIDGLHGNVETIGARSTRVRTGANLEIIVPNSKFLENNVTNLTLSDTRIRTTVAVGAAYGSPTREVERLLQKAVSAHPEVHADPAPIVLFKDFGDNSLAFEIHFWINAKTIMQSRKTESEIRHTIDDLFREAEITIAFPQRDIHLDSTRPLEVNLRTAGGEADRRFGTLPQRRAA